MDSEHRQGLEALGLFGANLLEQHRIDQAVTQQATVQTQLFSQRADQQAWADEALLGQDLAQRGQTLEATQLGKKPFPVHLADDLHQQSLGTAHDDLGVNEHYPQRTAVLGDDQIGKTPPEHGYLSF